MGQLGELSPAASVAVGIIVGLLSTSIQSIGLTLQRKSHLLEDEKEDEHTRRPPYRRTRWQIGMSMFIVANLAGSTIQITTLPLPVLSTLQASGLVFNAICASLILGEPFTRWSLAGTILVAGGAVLIALFGALPEPSHNLSQLLFLLGRAQFIVWMIGTGVLISAVLTLAILLGRVHTHNTPRIRLWRGMAFGSVSAILSSHSLLVAKSAVELLVRTIADGRNQFNRWQSWMILLALLFFALSQLYFLHKGLKLCSTSVLYPFVFCIYNIIAILDGLIYFRQTSRLPPLHGALIAVGTIILLSGIFALSWRLDHNSPAPPADAHTLLTPGMGIVEDTTTEDEGSVSTIASDDEEAALALDPTEHTPLLSNGIVQTPTMKDNAILKVTRTRRKLFATPANEAGAIWSELQDADDSEGASTYKSHGKQRRWSVASTVKPSKSQGRRFSGSKRHVHIDRDDVDDHHDGMGMKLATRAHHRPSDCFELALLHLVVIVIEIGGERAGMGTTEAHPLPYRGRCTFQTRLVFTQKHRQTVGVNSGGVETGRFSKAGYLVGGRARNQTTQAVIRVKIDNQYNPITSKSKFM